MAENFNENNNENIVFDSDTIRISNEVIATYAGIAVSEIDGVYAMAGGFAGFTEAISGKKNLAKGIKVEVEDKNVKIDVNIIVEYGSRIPDVAYEIQSKIKNVVESMTDLKVLEVNVNVQGVHKIKDDSVEKNDDLEDDGKEEE